MLQRYRQAFLLPALLVPALFCATARAGTVTATFDGVSPGRHVRIHTNDTSTNLYTAYGGSIGTTAGVFRFKNVTSDFLTASTFKAFDLELEILSSTNWSVVDLENAPLGSGPSGAVMGAAKADYIRELWGRHPDVIDTTSGTEAAAFQLAQWELVYDGLADGDVTIADTGFWVTQYGSVDLTPIKNLANSWLAEIDGTGPKEDNLWALARVGTQDFAVIGPGGSEITETVPLPATAWLGLGFLGLLGILRARRRRRERFSLT